MHRVNLVTSMTAARMWLAWAENETWHGRDDHFELGLVNASVFVPAPTFLQHPVLSGERMVTLSYSAAVAAGLVFFLACFSFVVGCFGPRGGLSLFASVVWPWPALLDIHGHSAPDEKRLLQEVAIGFWFQWAAVGVGVAVCSLMHRVSPPSFLLVIALPWLVRNAMLHRKWHIKAAYSSLSMDWTRLAAWAQIAVGKFEQLDAISDGLAVAASAAKGGLNPWPSLVQL